MGYSPWDCKVSDMTELLTTHTHHHKNTWRDEMQAPGPPGLGTEKCWTQPVCSPALGATEGPQQAPARHLLLSL